MGIGKAASRPDDAAVISRSPPGHDSVPFLNSEVARIFDRYPAGIRDRLLALRELIFDVAASTEGVGRIEETIKWGEPAYATTESGSGSTIRIDWKKSAPLQYAMYFHCRTTLVSTFRTMFPHDFKFQGNRAIVFGESDELPADALALCIEASLTYRLKQRGS